ncbi:MAG TPA: hypothetical protein VIN69_13190, partial [Candidatus Limnocylindria bacterium]
MRRDARRCITSGNMAPACTQRHRSASRRQRLGSGGEPEGLTLPQAQLIADNFDRVPKMRSSSRESAVFAQVLADEVSVLFDVEALEGHERSIAVGTQQATDDAGWWSWSIQNFCKVSSVCGPQGVSFTRSRTRRVNGGERRQTQHFPPCSA